MGFTCALFVTNEAVVSYTAFPPLPDESGGLFLLHWPWSRLHRTLSGILPCEARTFLSCGLSTLAAAIVCLTSKSFVILTFFQNVVKNFIPGFCHLLNLLHLLQTLQDNRTVHSVHDRHVLLPR